MVCTVFVRESSSPTNVATNTAAGSVRSRANNAPTKLAQGAQLAAVAAARVSEPLHLGAPSCLPSQSFVLAKFCFQTLSLFFQPSRATVGHWRLTDTLPPPLCLPARQSLAGERVPKSWPLALRRASAAKHPPRLGWGHTQQQHLSPIANVSFANRRLCWLSRLKRVGERAKEIYLRSNLSGSFHHSPISFFFITLWPDSSGHIARALS